ncbi:hypothetical protein KKH23_03070 [Patescibacteria group bacterium]|nr:hypothetical protein [Patescibacteria group bacterium]MBU0776703.1 hypothetical protein [Patescibacteria group bacterium]MBU0846147.1 hypothetical protein [Patescibacteria group bacterium]MBU0922764.1 hypothetical protein [Patescibacteria group bacterium]MBU1844924.1 hypothetical protein [Patescibacteria group bacterium]
MTETLNKILVPVSKRTVNFLHRGLKVFYPEIVFGRKDGKKITVPNFWPEGGYIKSDFAELLKKTTKKNDIDQAIKIVLEWKNLWDEGTQPDDTIPEILDDLVSSMDENATGEKKLSSYDKQALAKKTLLESQKQIEKSISIPEPIPATSSSTVVSRTAGRFLSAPYRAATYLSGPTTYSSSAKEEGPGTATARYMMSHGISSASIRSLGNKAQQLGITPSQLNNLANLIKTEQEAHPFSHKWISRIYSRQAGLSESQVASFLIPSADGSTAVLPRKSFVGNVIGRIGQQLFGKVSSKAFKAVGKKVAAKVTTTAAAQAIGAVVAPGLANIALLVVGKIKDFISSLKTKEGKERILALISGAMFLGGITLGGLLGAALVVGGFISGVGLLAAKAGGFGLLGASIGSFGQAFMAGLTGVVFPSIAAPLIISFISIPVMIAIILFIINSGAYIVPPSPFSESSFAGFPIECTTEKLPVSLPKPTTSLITVRAWEITSDLYQGFWCYWNRSPGDFPEDVTLYPPSYPDLFNEVYFEKDPFPSPTEASKCGNCLFWCTYLVQKAYRETGNTDIMITLWSPTMYEDFLRRGKIIVSSEATPENVVSGSVIFFQVLSGQNRINHVGIVHSTTKDSIQYIQSNAPTKDGSLTFSLSGIGIQDLPGIKIVGIGLP